MIRRSNDFGAGGVSVAVGELASGLDINPDAVPKKYEGLDGTELAISESQERMAVDIMEEVGHTIDPTEATLLERREIERRIHPYLEQLPTYQDRLQRVFTREKD